MALLQEGAVEDLKYALTGGARRLSAPGIYKGERAVAFVSPNGKDLPKKLRLLPDREGPVILLKSFGEIVFLRRMNNVTVTHPWLVYAELKADPDPRPYEAAEELRKEVLAD